MTPSERERAWLPSDAPTPMLVRAADRLYREVAKAIESGRLDARNPIADAALDYREERDDCVPFFSGEEGTEG